MECPQSHPDGVDWIVAYAAHTLEAAEEAAFERHLESCPGCRELAAAQSTVWSALDELTPLRVSPNFDALVFRRIAQEQQLPWWRRVWRADWSWRPVMPVAAAGAVLMVAFLVKYPGPALTPLPESQPKLQIEQVESALDDMDMLKQVGVEAMLENGTPRERI